ncbi:DnaB-like helicase N-terminal domain-containing protein [Streptomyces sp. STR69]|uniref:DnaB-like helicase N-terminal domain-containing protein n=1 Tax=Streptomyces sp. STR69 TaxID=1796942 RepID=UPI0021C72320|nr:DnaB-like helicase N-terminal domain-containing protein [Streptomyces sp. STR69]
MTNVRHMSPHDTADDDGLNRLPPSDPDAERALINRCINFSDEYKTAADIVGSDDFTQPAYRTLWDAIGQQLAESKPVDPVSLRATIETAGQLRLFSNGALIWDIAREIGPGDAEYYAGLVHAKTRLRRIDDLAVRLRSGVLNGGAAEDLEEQITGYVQQRSSHATGGSRFVPGGSFILDRPDTVPAIWGEGDNVLWAEGEALIIAGPAGVGKTTVGQQVLLAAIGIRPHALGLAVRPAKRVLYLASDRPQQAARSMARMVTHEHRDLLNQHLTFWPGPPPKDFIKDPGVLLRLCKQADADMVCLDSLKDMAGELASEEGGQAINSAIQRTLVEGIEVLALHHHRKQGGGKEGGKEPTSLDELYGSTWITAGAGSVVSLWGAAGDPIVSFKHLKQPSSECGPWRLKHDHPAGVTEVWHEVDVLDILAHARGPLTPHQLACQIYSPDKGKPSASEVEKARRRLDQLVEKGLAHKISNGGGRGSQTGYVAAFSATGELPEAG